MSSRTPILQMLEQWRAELPRPTADAVGTYFGALVVLDRLKHQTSLDLGDPGLFTQQGARVSGLNAVSVSRILAAIAPGLEVNAIGGRTSPGPALAARRLLEGLSTWGLPSQSAVDQQDALTECQRYVCDQIRLLQEQAKIEFVFDRSNPLQAAITDLLARYAGSPKVRAVAQHLVGAKLELRYPQIPISRESVDAADAPAGRPGDFVVNDFVFHVTVAPGSQHIAKCVANLAANRVPVLLVPENRISDAVAYAKDNPLAASRVNVRSIEAFVSQNIEELSEFSTSSLTDQVGALVRRYNERIRAAEQGKPFLEIEWSGLEDDA